MARRSFVQCIASFLSNGYLLGFLTGRIYQGKLKILCVPGFNCYSCPGALGACPLGALQSSLSGILPRFPFYVLGLMLLFGMLFGRFICGYLCPFGFFQDLLYKIPVKKWKTRKYPIFLHKMPYIILALTFILPIVFFLLHGVGIPFFCKYFCPVGTLEGAIPLALLRPQLFQVAGLLTFFKILILGIFCIIFIYIYRPFCRFFCPLGAWYGLFNRYALLGIVVDERLCTKCETCKKVCPLDAEIAGSRGCISCGKCIRHCKAGAIFYRNPLKK